MHFLSALLIAASLSSSMPQSPAVSEKAAGNKAAAEGKFDEAGRHYESAAREDPSEENLFVLGSFLLNHNGFVPAHKLFTYASAKYPKSARLIVGLGISEYSIGEYDAAVQTLCRAVDLDPTDDRALQFLGKMHDVSQAYAGQVTTRLQHFARIYPTNAYASYYYALCLITEADAGSDESNIEAERYLRRAIKLDSSLTAAHYQLGVLLEKANKIAQAIIQLKIVTTMEPSMVKAHYRLVWLYRKAGEEALARSEAGCVERLKAKESNIR